MAELATIARPYAEALFKTSADSAAAGQLDALAVVAGDEQVRHLADSPKASASLVFNVIGDVLMRKGVQLTPAMANLLQTVIDNGRIAALPEIAAQYRHLVSARSGVFDALIESAFPIDGALLPGVVAKLEQRFGRKLNASVHLRPELIGGIRVVVGDEVLDTSVKARLEQMKAVLSA
jgi:F-type H+-transporting ATPase subunit delta